jgi:nicotinamide mononucleotide transporter
LSILEILAALISLIGIFLAARGKVVSWPIGMVGVALTAWVAYDARLGGQIVLQAVYMVASAYGWYHWHKSKDKEGEVDFETLSFLELCLGIALAISPCFWLRPLLASFTSAERLNGDAAITAFSLLAQYWLTRKKIENWAIWIAVDAGSAVLFYQSGQIAMAVFFAVLVGVAGYGLWRHFRNG